LFDKELEIPINLLKAEALLGRLPEAHPQRQEIDGLVKKLRSGYNGEKVLNYYLGLLPEKRYYIYHGLRLPARNSFFQIDALLLSSKFILIIEGKNHSGKIIIERNQMIQEYGDIKEVYEDPVAQVQRHKLLLRYFLEKYHFTDIPIFYLVALTRTSTELSISPNYHEAVKSVCRAYHLLSKMEELERADLKTTMDDKKNSKIRKLLLKSHVPLSSNLMQQYRISFSELEKGVRCLICGFIPMNYHRNSWHCPHCQAISKEAHLKGINDYFFLIKPEFTNPELREFLLLPSSRSTSYLLSLLNLPYAGIKRARHYLLEHPLEP
jgi:rubrerythrin